MCAEQLLHQQSSPMIVWAITWTDNYNLSLKKTHKKTISIILFDKKKEFVVPFHLEMIKKD